MSKIHSSTKLPEHIQIYNSIEEFDKNLPETVSLLKTPHGSKVYLVGTAHFSIKSQDDVSLVMRNVKPDVLVLELCPLRLHILHYDEERLLREASELNKAKMAQIYRNNGIVGGSFYIQFLKMSANVTQQLGMAPGGECRRAVAEAKQIGDVQILLGDRPINITMQRAVRGLTIGQKIKLMLFFAMAGRSEVKITQEDVERFKKKEEFEKPMGDASHQLPSLYNSFVKERDELLTHSLQYASLLRRDDNGNILPNKVVGVVGIGHSPGIIRNWGKVTTDQVRGYMVIPPYSPSQRLFSASIRFAGIALIGYSFYKLFLQRKKND